MALLPRCLTATWIFGLNQAGGVKHFGSESVFHVVSPFFVSTAVLTLDCGSGPSLAAALTQTKNASYEPFQFRNMLMKTSQNNTKSFRFLWKMRASRAFWKNF